MIINDLSHLEVISEETNVTGMGHKKPTKKKYGVAIAKASADSLAIGKYTLAATYTSTTAVAGVYSASSSGSFAATVG